MSKPIAELRMVGEIIGREGMSLMAQKFIAEYDGSYKGVMKLCGELSIVAKMATCDSYWEEKVHDGIRNAVFIVEKEEV
mgnify:CR=1 FL=1|tara:strand:- start:61 stop:297 length:237 start_codon:yes stop_codon:yes gene_type:complete